MALKINKNNQTEVMSFLEFILYVNSEFKKWDKSEINIPFIRCEDGFEELFVKLSFRIK